MIRTIISLNLNKYLLEVYNKVQAKDKNEPEFLQAVYEVLNSIEPYVNEHPELEKNGIIYSVIYNKNFM